MQYKDYTDSTTGERWINGQYVGIRIGTPLKDGVDPTSDGYSHLRDTRHIGTMTQDGAAKIQFEPKEE